MSNNDNRYMNDRIRIRKPSTINAFNQEISTVTYSGENVGKNKSDIDDLFKAYTKMNNRLNDLEEENRLYKKELDSARIRENKLLDRFSAFLLIINIGFLILIIISVVLFVDAFLPFINKLFETSRGALWVIGSIGGLIFAAIVNLWIKVEKYLKKVIDIEKEH